MAPMPHSSCHTLISRRSCGSNVELHQKKSFMSVIFCQGATLDYTYCKSASTYRGSCGSAACNSQERPLGLSPGWHIIQEAVVASDTKSTLFCFPLLLHSAPISLFFLSICLLIPFHLLSVHLFLCPHLPSLPLPLLSVCDRQR